MSYGGRRIMTKDDDLLFRVVVHVPPHEAERKVYKMKYDRGRVIGFERDEKGNAIIERVEKYITDDSFTYEGPYTSLRSARSQMTSAVKHNAKYNRDYPVHINIEACMPEWKVVE